MKLDLDDPKLTAYALGELDDAELKAIESQLKESEEGRRRHGACTAGAGRAGVCGESRDR